MITGKINMSGASSQKSAASLKAVAAKTDANAKRDAKATPRKRRAPPTGRARLGSGRLRRDPDRLRDALDDVSLANAVGDMHAHLLSGFCDLDRLVVEFQPVERLIEVGGVSAKMNGVSRCGVLRGLP